MIPTTNPDPDRLLRSEVRNILRLAQEEIEDESTREWLRRDEYGTWEKRAIELLAKTALKAAQLGMSDEGQECQIAVLIAYEALTAMLSFERKELAEDRPRKREQRRESDRLWNEGPLGPKPSHDLIERSITASRKYNRRGK